MTYVINYLEVNNMPGRDRTGPIGAGPMTGRGLGFCTGTGLGMGLGLGCRRGFGRGFNVSRTSPKTQKEILQEQKNLLESRLKIIDEQLENM
jgi:hypothetical protein